METYEKKRNKTFYISLQSPIPVSIYYNPFEISGKEIRVYQDLYRKIHKKSDYILSLLTAKGFTENQLDLEKIEAVSKEWGQGKSLSLLVEDLLKSDKS